MRPTAPIATVLFLAGVMLLAGCGKPPGLTGTDGEAAPLPPATSTGSPSPPGGSASPGGFSPPGPPGTGSPGDYPEEIALSCTGNPAEEELLAVLVAEGVLPTDMTAELTDGPYCSGSWQYAVVGAPERDPLQVVTRGEPGALTLVTAGTDVCTVEVRLQAPSGILGVAACVG